MGPRRHCCRRSLRALRFYNGKWQLISGDQKAPTNIENHCAQTGVFYSCEQIVDGKTAALVVFLPMSKTGGEEYRTHVLTPDAKPSGNLHDLTIEGDKWFYTWNSTETGTKVFWRDVITFSGPDKIHFEIQSSADGNTWETQKQGDEQRIK